jgi:transposase
MRTKGSAHELENRQRLAVRRVQEDWSEADVAAFLGVDPRTVRHWLARHRADPEHGLGARPHPGRPRSLTAGTRAAVAGDERRPLEWRALLDRL